MTITLRLKHLWKGVVNSPTANPIMLAARDAGLPDIRQISKDFAVVDNHVVAIPFKQALYLARLRAYEDRFEALPDETLKRLQQEAVRLQRWDSKHDSFTPISPEFPLLSFSIGGSHA